MLRRIFSRERIEDALVVGLIQTVVLGGGVALVGNIIQDPTIRDWAVAVVVPVGLLAGGAIALAYTFRRSAPKRSAPQSPATGLPDTTDLARRLAAVTTERDELKRKLDVRQRRVAAIEAVDDQIEHARNYIDDLSRAAPTAEQEFRGKLDRLVGGASATVGRYWPDRKAAFDAPLTTALRGGRGWKASLADQANILIGRLEEIRKGEDAIRWISGDAPTRSS